ncbi:hypothetical protein D6858_02005 [Tsuneonella suprasediminis]|uniref:Uncharacterized protein n=1 Tax=Tsuneonella suprasediminis TaxID=2306996 RepID=A0A419R565_9SPHN|nr:hypothetical protein D6858_02005 [Tsuneonella suprasediminis]
MTQPAKVLAPPDVRRLYARAGRGRFAVRNRLIILLSFKAGLRACEIAGLDWSMALTAKGRVAANRAMAKLRCHPLQRPQSYRTLLQQDQTLQTHRHPIRQTRQKLRGLPEPRRCTQMLSLNVNGTWDQAASSAMNSG